MLITRLRIHTLKDTAVCLLPLQHTAKLCLWCLSKQLVPASMLEPVLTDILGAVVPYLVTAPSSDRTRHLHKAALQIASYRPCTKPKVLARFHS